VNKILIEIYVPLIEKKYEVFVPINKKIRRVIVLLNEAISELTDGIYIAPNNTFLYNKFTGDMLKPEVLVKDSGLKNGSKVILI